MTGETTSDLFYKGRLHLTQLAQGHRVGTDAVLLAALGASQSGQHFIDMGAGVGAVGLMLALHRPEAQVTLIEREAELAGLAFRNVDSNQMADRVAVKQLDVLDAKARREAGLLADSVDVLVTNPPFLNARRHRVSPDALKARAHHEDEGGLESWLRAAASLLKSQGILCLIHRAEILPDLLTGLKGRFGAVEVTPVYPQGSQAAHRVLVRAVKGSRAPLQLCPGLILHEASGGFTPLAQCLHEGTRVLPSD